MKNDFSKQFRPILTRACQLVAETGAEAIRPEHLVLDALRNRDGYAFKILTQLRVPIDKMAADIEDYLPPPPTRNSPRFSRRNSRLLSRLSAISNSLRPRPER